MKQDSWKTSLKMGVIAGSISFGVYVFLVFGSGMLTGWQTFFGADFSVQKIGMYSWEIVAAVGVILASLVPAFTLRYEKVRYLFFYLLVSLVALIWLYGTMLAVWMMVNAAWCPFITLDALYYFTIAIPIGSIIGTIVAFVIHFLARD